MLCQFGAEEPVRADQGLLVCTGRSLCCPVCRLLGQTGVMARPPVPSKPCARCGRTIIWRKVWACDWDSVRRCSDNCHKHGLGDVDRQFEASLELLLDGRSASASVCPSEAARAVGADDWSELIEPARMAARRLVATGRAEVTHGGQVIDPSRFRGPIRVRRPR